MAFFCDFVSNGLLRNNVKDDTLQGKADCAELPGLFRGRDRARIELWSQHTQASCFASKGGKIRSALRSPPGLASTRAPSRCKAQAYFWRRSLHSGSFLRHCCSAVGPFFVAKQTDWITKGALKGTTPRQSHFSG